MTEATITAICQECNKQFEYVLKPGFPRKYCLECGEAKKASYAAKAAPSENGLNLTPQKPGKVDESDPKGSTTMYVGYAKDIFCEIYEKDFNKEDLMNMAINLVKQAREAFS